MLQKVRPLIDDFNVNLDHAGIGCTGSCS